MNIVHISKTPLAGSPNRFSDELNKLDTVQSVCFIERDYPGDLCGKFIGSSIIINQNTKPLLIDVVSKADVCHIHNDLSHEIINLILSNCKQCKFIYHVHSPLREGPLFFYNYESMGIDFFRKIVVAQYHPRLYQDFIPLLNIVPFKPNLSPTPITDKIRIIFSPSHNRVGGRWNDKTSTELRNALNLISKKGDIELVIPDKLSPHTLFELRRSCHITIDEIVTGSYHQISLEGLAAGNVVINNSDCLSNTFLEQVAEADSAPPFIIMNNRNVTHKLNELINNRDEIIKIQH
ncbi:hypothetical protein OGB53_004665, partial [Escherichia coli]|nr:hypothetical protein [Escherichia coli]